MTTEQLYKTLALFPDTQAARDIAAKFLEQTREDDLGFVRIINPSNGQWVDTFTANGNKYRIISPKEGVSLARYVKLRSALSVVGQDATFAEQIQNINEAKSLVEALVRKEEGIVRLSVILDNMSRAISGGQKQWHYSAWAATLFIAREGEELNGYSEELAEQKIEDWNKENISQTDFFFCCWEWEKRWNDGLREFSIRLMN